MYVRFIELKIDPDSLKFLQSFYETFVWQELQKQPGCLYTAMVQNHKSELEFIFLTLWENLDDAVIYENSDAFSNFQKQIQPFLSESTEWKMQLDENLKLEYKPVQETPQFSGYQIIAKYDSQTTKIKQESPIFLRLVSIKLQQNKTADFRKVYTQKIIPALRKTPGCLYAYLIEPVSGDEQLVSMTIWESRAYAEAYEKSGLFTELTAQASHTFSTVFQWKISLDKEQAKNMRTSDDMQIRTYELVSGKLIYSDSNFKPSE